MGDPDACERALQRALRMQAEAEGEKAASLRQLAQRLADLDQLADPSTLTPLPSPGRNVTPESAKRPPKRARG
eukprot:865028-Pyramimonas_sp.AAC.1